MRVLVLTHYFSTHGGGVETVAWHIARRLASDHEADVTWVAAGVDPVPQEPALRFAALPAWNPLEPRFGLPYPLLKLGGVVRLWRAVGECEVVHIHECQYLHALLGAIFCRLRGKPYLVTQHVGEVEYRSPIKRCALAILNVVGTRVVLDSAAQVMFVSARVMAYFRAWMRHPEAARLVENGVDAQLFRPITAEERQAARASLGLDIGQALVAFAGRFVEKKGLRLIEALARARPQVRFILAGQGPIDPSHWRLPNVVVAGVLDAFSLANLYNAADLLCIPSFGEGFPLVVQEAMACGCPVLMDTRTASGAGLEGWPVFAVDVLGDNALALAAACLDNALSEPAEDQRRRRQATAAVAQARWSWDKSAQAHAASILTAGAKP